MNPNAPLLVGYDGSPYARAAAGTARAFAARTGARTLLVSVATDEVSPAELDAALAEEAGLFATPVETRVITGRPADALAAEAQRVGASMIAVGTRGRGAVGRALFGSVADALLRWLDLRVLAVHDPVRAVRGVVVGVDDTERVGLVVAEARALAGALGAPLTLAHVLPGVGDLAAHPEFYGIARERWNEMVKNAGDRVFAPHRAGRGAQEEERVLFGPVAEALRELAERSRADVVAVGRHRNEHPWSIASQLAARGPGATLVV
jgi:nucleotide-binding universal stress UspA family protein